VNLDRRRRGQQAVPGGGPVRLRVVPQPIVLSRFEPEVVMRINSPTLPR
jgi:hypothetical protein